MSKLKDFIEFVSQESNQPDEVEWLLSWYEEWKDINE